MHILKEGDRGEALCERCRKWVTTHYEYRSIVYKPTKARIENILVGVCDTCNDVAAIPHQSSPKLQEAATRAPVLVEARVPGHLDDILGLVAASYGVRDSDFRGSLFKFYFREIADNPSVARRIRQGAESDLAQGPARSRVAFRLGSSLLDEAWAAASNAGVKTRSDMIKGVIVVANEDVLEGRAPRRRDALSTLALVAE